MKIGFIYDTPGSYNIDNNLSYSDFCQEQEAAFICETIESLGHEVVVIGTLSTFLEQNSYNSYDLIFNKCEGFNSRNREGLAPACLEALDIPYVGTDAYGLSLSLNKFHTKLIVDYYGIATPRFSLLRDYSDLSNINIQYPLIVKPNNEGSSMGVHLVHNQFELNKSVEEIWTLYGDEIICEEFIDGDEISVPIIETENGIKILGIAEFRNIDGERFNIYTTDDKYITGCKSYIYECNPLLKRRIEDYSRIIFQELGLLDYGRVDFRVRNNIPYFLEVNPLPTLDKDTSFVLCSEYNGIDFKTVLDNVINNALRRYAIRKKKRKCLKNR